MQGVTEALGGAPPSSGEAGLLMDEGLREEDAMLEASLKSERKSDKGRGAWWKRRHFLCKSKGPEESQRGVCGIKQFGVARTTVLLVKSKKVIRGQERGAL